MKIFTTLSLACCMSLAAVGVAAQDKKDAMSTPKKEMTAADCKSYTDMAAKDAKMKDAAKDAQCKALADKEKAKK